MGKNCLVAQSGGPTAVINASLCGVVQAALKSEEIDRIYGAVYGIEGFINEKMIDFTDEDMEEIELLKYTPSSALGSCRYKLKDYTVDEEEYKKIFSNFEKYNIKYFFYVGGNDSMDTVDKLSRYAQIKGYDIRIMGVPKTIDNDLYGTDHTPGFGSAAKYIAASVMELARDAAVYDKGIINIVEVMGRNAGWLAASSVLARLDRGGAPHLIYLPEVAFDLDKFVSDVSKKYKEHKKVTVVVSEGIKYSNGKFVCEDESNKGHDRFGHSQMGGVGAFLGGVIKERVCSRVKVIEYNVLQRCASHYASDTDIREAHRCGYDAVKYAVNGETGKMVILKRVSSNPYKCETDIIPVNKSANHEKKFPLEWINEEGNFVTDDVFEYVKPLIQGDVILPTRDGLPRFAQLKIQLNK